jgi:hypothetical protein
MCDYSLHLVTSRPAKVGDKVVSTNFTNSVKREGAALALSACDRDEPAIEADSNLLGIAIAQAIDLE